MNDTALLDDVSGVALDRAWLLSAIAPASDYGARALRMLRPFAPGEESAAAERAKDIARVAQCMDRTRLDAARHIFRAVPDAVGSIARASMGEVLADANLLELQRVFDAALRVDALLSGAGLEACANDAVRELSREFESGRSGKLGFYLSDAFDGTLTETRNALARAQAEYDAVRGRAASLVADALGRDDLANGEFIVMRGDCDGALPAGASFARRPATVCASLTPMSRAWLRSSDATTRRLWSRRAKNRRDCVSPK